MQDYFKKNPHKNLNIFFTAGYPYLHATTDILKALQNAGCNMVEIGMPFSDPLADGETIQESSQIALKNGMNIEILFKQLKDIRKTISMPIILMGYLNPIIQYGFENFLKQCKSVGVNATILPDLPIDIYEKDYKRLYEKYSIHNIFLVTPETKTSRIKKIDSLSTAFIYLVSSSSTTGGESKISDQKPFFQRIKTMSLKTPLLIGFGIKNKNDFDFACTYSNGAILGSSFVKIIANSQQENIQKTISTFISNLL